MMETWTMLKREYWVRVRRRRFLVSTILAPVFWIVPFAVPVLLISFQSTSRTVTVLDQSGDPELFGIIERNLADSTRTGTQFNLTHQVVPQERDIDEVRASLTEEITLHADRAYLVLRRNILEGQNPQYYANNVTDLSLPILGNAVSTAVTQRRLAHDGLDPAKIKLYGTQIQMTAIKVSAEGETREGGQTFLVSMLVIFSIFATVSGYSAIVMHSVMEEKQSRIIELLATSAAPHQIMASKLIGVGLVGLTQYAVWSVLVLVIKQLGSVFLSIGGLQFPAIPLRLLIYGPVFFLLGYFLMATLYLIIGAIASKPEDAETLRRPLFILNVVPMFVFWIILQDPASNLSVAISMIPFFAPTMMMMRLSLAATPAWQVALSIAIMIITIILSLKVASKVYRMGLLLYGKKMSLTEVGRWLRYS